MRSTGKHAALRSAISRRSFLGACALGAASLLAGCKAAPEESSDAGSAMEMPVESDSQSDQDFEQISTTLFAFDTVVTITASCSQEALDAAAQRCEYFESIFSRTIETSDIGRINAAHGEPVRVAPETADIVSKALRYCEESNGLFDISIGAVSTLWDFREGVVPDPAELEEAVKHVDYTCIQVDGDTITLTDPDAKLDLGGIAKGYIADDLCRLLADMGCTSGFVNLGGNVKTIGRKPNGKPWHVGVQDSNDVAGTVVAAVYSEGTSIVTSGLYERQFEKDGQRYWHILDPTTGYPVETDLVSVSIVSQDSIDGDGYATSLFMMGHDAALEWINAQEGLEGLVVDAQGAITQSDGCDAELM